MKILMLTPYVPYPPSSGGQIRTLNLLKYLAKKNQITLVALYKNDEEKKYISHLKKYCRHIHLCKRAEKPWQFNNVIKAVFSLLPFLIVRNYSDEATKRINKLLEEEHFDVIHAETFYIMPHIPSTSIPILLVEQTIEYKVYQHFINSLPFFIRMFFYLDIFKLKNWEQYYWQKASVVAAVSKSDGLIIKKHGSGIKTVIIPNGAGDEMIATKLTEKKIEPPLILFHGNFNWLQNVEAAHYLIDHIVPQLTKKVKTVQVIISGQNAHKIETSRKNSNMRILEIQADDSKTVKKLFQDASLFIAPIFGPGGTRLKILAAMASGTPIISTQTGVEGLSVVDTIHVAVARNSGEFVNSIISLLKNKKKYEYMRKNAYELVKKEYSWKNITLKLELIYQSITTV